MANLQGASNHRYHSLLKGGKKKLVEKYEGEDSDAGKLARLARQLEQAVTAADKEGFYFNKCPLCGATQGTRAPTKTVHHRDCEWPGLIARLRE